MIPLALIGLSSFLYASGHGVAAAIVASFGIAYIVYDNEKGDRNQRALGCMSVIVITLVFWTVVLYFLFK